MSATSGTGRETGRDPVRVRVCPDGPLLLRGADEVMDADGRAHPVTRPVVAVCVCGGTARSPWCDGTHALLKRDRAAKGS
ncbi:CDGSH iron-sulfur domain-containing protein [Nocardioides sp. CPCC 205120]|uniref:CDGSH iron-sulfur domain-containing protein n=1 Tax=Nocardioides sp. CPCC 205120 TaxID=3406462 RepID=UPI003B506561